MNCSLPSDLRLTLSVLSPDATADEMKPLAMLRRKLPGSTERAAETDVPEHYLRTSCSSFGHRCKFVAVVPQFSSTRLSYDGFRVDRPLLAAVASC